MVNAVAPADDAALGRLAADAVQPRDALVQRAVAPGFPDEDILGAFERQREQPDQQTGDEHGPEAAV